ncbi:MAG: tetratricopeptide repeat protein [Acidobacteriota bacterium]
MLKSTTTTVRWLAVSRAGLAMALNLWRALAPRNLVLAAAFHALIAAPGVAQHHGSHSASRLPAASLPPPPLMDGIGGAEMTISTDSELAQKYFNQGVNLLHCFWDFEAYRAFRESIRQDDSVAMAYWGLFMSLNYNQREHLEERERTLARAQQLAKGASDREQRYIRAIERLNAEPGQAGQAAFVREMDALVAAYPEDLQAKLFLIKFLVTEVGGGYSTSPGEGGESGFEKARSLLRDLLRSHPNDAAVHHYWIHVHEYGPNPGAALESARKLPSLAPSSGHILHMPGHIYYQLGEYDKAYTAFHRSLEFDQKYLDANGLEAIDNWNYTHNLDYLVANCAEDGRYQEGLRWARKLGDLKVELERDAAVGLGFIIYGGRSAETRLHMRYGRWDKAAEILEDNLSAWRFPSHQGANYLGGLLEHSRGMAAIGRGDLQEASKRFQKLLGLSVQLSQMESELGSDWYFEAARRIVAIATVELGGTLMSSQGQHDQAIEQLRQATAMEIALGYGEPPHYSRPVWESLATVYLRAGRWQDAKDAYEKVLEERPNSGHALYGIARSLVQGGRKSEARAAYERFLDVWRHADSDLPQITRAKRWLQANP